VRKAVLLALGIVLILVTNASAVVPGYRAFSDTSEWNKPLPTNAPLHPKSSKIIAEIKGYDATNEPRLGAGAFADPIYWADANDPVYTIVPTRFGNTLFNIHIPLGSQPGANNDGHMTVYDFAKGVVFGLFEATYDSATDTWTAGGTSEYALTSNGLHCQLPESDAVCPMNTGHRGYPNALSAARYDEVELGAINHVLKVSLAKTAPCVHYPGEGFESGRGGVLTCEGLILRIKPSINLATRGLSPGALVIAEAMQDYGVVIGDTGGNAMTLKVENLAVEGRPETWSTFGITNTSFVGKITFNDFVVIQAGYHRP
jgi:hypothetical protein